MLKTEILSTFEKNTSPMKKHIFFLALMIPNFFPIFGQTFVKTITGPSQWPTSAVISKDGKTLYVGCYDKHIWVFDISEGRPTDTLVFHEAAVTTLDISSQGLLASAGWDKQIAIWKGKAKNPLLTMKGHKDKINSIKFSPDGNYLGSVGDDGTLIIWDVTTGGIIKEIAAHKDPVTSLCFSSNGKIIATAGWDKTIRFWNVATGEMISEFRGHKNSINHIQYSSNEQYIVSCSDDNSMIVWETATGKIFKKYDFYTEPVTQAQFISNDNQLISTDQKGELKIYNTNNHQLLVVREDHKGKTTAIAWHPDNGILITCGEDLKINIWDLSEYNHYECLKKKIGTIETYKRPKEEFESTEQYEARLKGYEIKKTALVEECKKDAQIEKQALEKMRIDKEAQAYSWVTLNFTGIGNYDADNTELPVMIGNQTYILKIAPAEAKSLKENWQKAKIKAVRKDIGGGMFLLYNLEMTHPVSGKGYKFGNQITANDDPAFKIFIEKKK